MPDLWSRLRYAFVASVVIGLLIPAVMGHWSALSSVGFILAAWVTLTTMRLLIDRVKVLGGQASVLSRLVSIPRSFYGMLMGHMGIAVFIMGVTMIQTYQVEKDLRMDVGDTTEIGGYVFRFDGVTEVPGPNYTAQRGHVQVMKDGDDVASLYPEKRMYNSSGMPMTEAGIDTSMVRDLYVSLGEPIENGAWSVRVYYKPYVVWIWGGCLLMGLGGLWAAMDRRYRILKQKVAQQPESAPPRGGKDEIKPDVVME